MKLHRIQVKAFAEDPSSIDSSALIDVFHKWIQNDALGEMLIDVADYAHVPEGPGVVLIAHEADYALEAAGGRPGLLYTRKRDVPATRAEALALSLKRLFAAAHLLEEDPSLEGAYRFRSDEVEIRFLDRLQIPNAPGSLELVRGDVESVLADQYGGSEITVESCEDDPRLPFAVRATLSSAPAVSELAERSAAAAK